jgi:thiol:disulfide interchange protein
MLVFFATSIYTFLSNARRFLVALVIREPWAISLVLWFAVLLFSQVYDKTLARENPNWKLRSIEEMLEVTAALYAVSAISLFSFKQWSNRNNKIPTVESNKK